jgi:hypothetical protein
MKARIARLCRDLGISPAVARSIAAIMEGAAK